MASTVKKAPFEELYETFTTVLSSIDTKLDDTKKSKKGKSIWSGHSNYNTFLKQIERQAIKDAAKTLNVSDGTVRERWKVLTLPIPVFSAIEEGEISYSKAKPLTSINFDTESDEDQIVVNELLDAIKEGISVKELKEKVKEESTKIWNHSSITMQNIASHHNLRHDTIC